MYVCWGARPFPHGGGGGYFSLDVTANLLLLLRGCDTKCTVDKSALSASKRPRRGGIAYPSRQSLL